MKALRLALLLVVLCASRATAQPALAGTASAVASAWSGRDADALARLLSARGVALYLLDESHPAAGVRQARAALADVLQRGGQARVTKVEELGGTPRRGMAELSWEAGSPAGDRLVIFLGFVLEDGSWKIGEIRLLR